MNFSRKASSNFFKGKTIKSFMNNKFSCSFLNNNMNKKIFNTRNFIMLSNAFFLNNIQRVLLANKSLNSNGAEKLMIGEESQKENLENSSSIIIENLLEGKFISEFLIGNNSK